MTNASRERASEASASKGRWRGEEQEKDDQQRFPFPSSSSKLLRFFSKSDSFLYWYITTKKHCLHSKFFFHKRHENEEGLSEKDVISVVFHLPPYRHQNCMIMSPIMAIRNSDWIRMSCFQKKNFRFA